MNNEIIPVGYARYSTDRQTDNSIEYQKNAILKFCKKEKLVIRRFYTDEAKTGTNATRDGFRALMQAGERGEYNAVVVYDITRGSRDVADWFTFRKIMMELGITVLSVSQELGDLTNPSDFIKEALEVTIGQYEVLQTRQKSIAGVNTKAKKGVFLGGIPPLGYDIKKGKYIINPREAEWVRLIFNMYADGKSYNQIIDALKKRNAKGKRGRPVGKNSLYSILRNERYIGVYTWNKRRVKTLGKWAGGTPNPNATRIENAIPPIITKEVWERVQIRVTNNKHNARNSAKRSYLLSGLIECESCGAIFIGRTSTNSKGYESSSYVCGNKYRTRTCNAKNINANEVETFVMANLKEYLRTADFSKVAQDIAEQVNNATPDLKKEKNELAQIETKIHNGIQAILSGMEIPELQSEIDKMRVRKEELEDVIARTESQRGSVEPQKIVQLLEECAEQLYGDTATRVVNYLINKIYAHPDGSCTVSVGVSLNGCGGTQQVVSTTFLFKVA